MSTSNFQERFLLNLSQGQGDVQVAKTILKSPLELAVKMVKLLFENNFDPIKDDLDSIKQFVAGISRSENTNGSYPLAKFYPYLFSFHQYIHSSYRARQGKVLEVLFKELLERSPQNFTVANNTSDKKGMMSDVVADYDSESDIDVMAQSSGGRTVVIQLRSRDDTGGTTAKSSLADVLRQVIEYKEKISDDADLLYIIGIWDTVKSNQKNSTIKKVYKNLAPYLDGIDEAEFTQKIEDGIELHKGVVLKLSYGSEKIIEDVFDVGDEASSMQDLIAMLKTSDDLWLAYSIVSLELENIKLKGDK